MAEWQNRLSNERDQLEERLTKLRAFIITDGCGQLPLRDRQLLTLQSAAMEEYLLILNERSERLEAGTK